MQAPSDAARPNHSRVLLEKSGEGPVYPAFDSYGKDTSTKPFREAENGSAPLRKSRPKEGPEGRASIKTVARGWHSSKGRPRRRSII